MGVTKILLYKNDNANSYLNPIRTYCFFPFTLRTTNTWLTLWRNFFFQNRVKRARGVHFWRKFWIIFKNEGPGLQHRKKRGPERFNISNDLNCMTISLVSLNDNILLEFSPHKVFLGAQTGELRRNIPDPFYDANPEFS